MSPPEDPSAHVYYKNFKPTHVLPEAARRVEDDPLSPGLLAKAKGRAKYQLRIGQAIAAGERPEVKSGEGNGAKWVREQIANLIKAGLQTGAPKDYYTENRPPPRMEFSAAPQAMVQEAAALEQALDDTEIRFRVLGTRRYLRPQQVAQAQRNSDLLIAVPGDVRALLEFQEILDAKLNATSAASPILSKPLIIENRDQLFDPILANLQFLEYRPTQGGMQRWFVDAEKLARRYGIYITTSMAETTALAKALAAKLKDQPTTKQNTPPSEPPQGMQPGATIFVATGTRKKFHEMQELYERQRLNVNLLPIDLLVDSYVSPDENARSYEGNAVQKLEAAFQAWERMPVAARANRLSQLGERLHSLGRRQNAEALKEEEIYVLSEDSGFHFLQRHPRTGQSLAGAKEFANLGNKIDVDAPFPGVETGPGVLGSFGVTNFFATVEQILLRYKNAGHSITHEVTEKSVLALARLREPHSDQNRQIITYSGETSGRFISQPQPPGGAAEIDHFIIPRGCRKTKAALSKKLYFEHSPRAHAWDGMVADMRFPLLGQGKHQKRLQEKDYRVGVVHDPNHEAAASAVATLLHGAHVNGLSFHGVKSNIQKLDDVQTAMLDGKDAVVLAFNPARAKEDFWQNLWTFSSLIVGEQTRDKYKLEKPIYLINPKNGEHAGAFNALEEITHALHQLGTIPENPATLYHSVSTIDEAVEAVKAHRGRTQHLRYDPPSYARGEAMPASGDKSPKEFNVAVFISASNENEKICTMGTELTEKLAAAGMGVFSGAGMYSGMGAITRAAITLRDTEQGVHHTGITVPHIMDGKEVQGKNIRELVDRFHLCRNIYERIEGLLAADAAIVAPGGMGTVQELAGFALLKQQALSNPESDTHGFAHKELVILNAPIAVNGTTIGFYDALIKQIPGGDLHKLGIHVVETAQQAIEKMQELRNAKRCRLQQEPALGNGR